MSHPVDVHVGHKIKAARNLRDLSLMEISSDLGVSFQQVQKYETGANRIAASRLFSIAKLLGVSIDYFFEGLPEHNGSIRRTGRDAKAETQDKIPQKAKHRGVSKPTKAEKDQKNTCGCF